MKQLFLIINLFLVLHGCSSGGLKDRDGLRKLYQQRKYNESIQYLKTNKFYNKNDSRLLKLMEEGIIYHSLGDYLTSIKILEQAKELSRQLYTKSLSKKAKTLITNDNYDVFYGEVYEQSLIYFYLSLNHYLYFQTNKKLTDNEKRLHKQGARAEILAWDSFLTGIRDERLGNTVYKKDILAKVYGGFIHEAMNTRNDDQIALQLYKDAQDIMLKNYNSYPVFNGISKKFKSNFSKFPKMKINKIKSDFVKKTEYQNELDDYLDEKILLLTKKIRPSQMKRVIRIYKPKQEIIDKVKKSKRSNISIVLQNGVIPQKIPDKYYIGLSHALRSESGSTRAIARIGATVLTLFATQTLGLTPSPANWSPAGATIGIHVASFAAQEVAISFELPIIEKYVTNDYAKIIVKNSAGKEVLSKSIPLVSPLGDIASEAVAEKAGWRYSRLGMRLVVKHLTAIIAAYATYKALKKNSKFLAKTAAVIEYVGATKLIENSEKADTRFWSTLPADIRMTDFFLPKGDYQLALQVSRGESQKTYQIGRVKVDNTNKKQVINYRISQ
jgi:tetratricopeptide (TPR) repeat protein